VASPLTDRALVFAGFMGAGKTVAARALAAAWGVEPIDTDALLEREIGVRIPDFFAEQGEEAFRLREEVAVAHALDQAPPGSVMALGGGALGSKRVREALKRHLVVWLDVDVDTCWARAGEQGDRPLARDPAAFARLFQDRQAAYEAAADAVVLNRSLDAVPTALPALVDLAGRPRDTRLLWAWSASAQYPVLLRDGLLDDEAVTSWPAEGRRFLVTDGAVAKLYADRLEPLAGRVSIMPGE